VCSCVTYANSIIPKKVLPGLQTEEDLEAALTEPIFENEDVEINKDDENLEIRDVENVIPVSTQKLINIEKNHTLDFKNKPQK